MTDARRYQLYKTEQASCNLTKYIFFVCISLKGINLLKTDFSKMLLSSSDLH